MYIRRQANESVKWNREVVEALRRMETVKGKGKKRIRKEGTGEGKRMRE